MSDDSHNDNIWDTVLSICRLSIFSQSGEIWIAYTLFSGFLKEIIIHQEIIGVNIPVTGCFLFHAWLLSAVPTLSGRFNSRWRKSDKRSQW